MLAETNSRKEIIIRLNVRIKLEVITALCVKMTAVEHFILSEYGIETFSAAP